MHPDLLLPPAKDINERIDRLEKVVSSLETTPTPGTAKQPFIIITEQYGKINTAGKVVKEVPVPVSVRFPKGLADSQAFVGVPPKATAEYSIRRNGVEFAKLIITTDGDLSWRNNEDALLAAGDRISVVGPMAKDSKLETVVITLLGWVVLT